MFIRELLTARAPSPFRSGGWLGSSRSGAVLQGRGARCQDDNRADTAETPQPCPTIAEGGEQNRPRDGGWVQPRARITGQAHSDGTGPVVKPGS